MTKRKEPLTEAVDGSGRLADLFLIVKPGSRSGYYGVIPAGDKWQARVYKPEKQRWEAIDTFDTAREAAIYAALAKKDREAGLPMPSPLKRRHRKGATRHPSSERLPSPVLRPALHCSPLTARLSPGLLARLLPASLPCVLTPKPMPCSPGVAL